MSEAKGPSSRRFGDRVYEMIGMAECFCHRYLRRRQFSLAGSCYRYFAGMYMETWKTERAVEVPVAMELLCQYPPEQVLEIGNVLRHYFPVTHDVVDKYEKYPGVINEDVVCYAPSKTYDLIIAISTLEHVGWEETPVEPKKIFSAVNNLVNLLTPGGRFFFSVPVGYRGDLDVLLRERLIAGARLDFMKRTGMTTWVECGWEGVDGCRFGTPWPAATAMAFGLIQKDAGGRR